MRKLTVLFMCWLALSAFSCSGAASNPGEGEDEERSGEERDARRTRRSRGGGGSASGGGGGSRMYEPSPAACDETGVGGWRYYCPGDPEAPPSPESSVPGSRTNRPGTDRFSPTTNPR